MMGLTRYAAVVIRAYYFVCAKFLVLTRALIPACRFSVVPVVLWSCRAYMFLTRAKYSAYLLSASSRAVDLSLSFVCVLWEPDPSLEPMGVLQRPVSRLRICISFQEERSACLYLSTYSHPCTCLAGVFDSLRMIYYPCKHQKRITEACLKKC